MSLNEPGGGLPLDSSSAADSLGLGVAIEGPPSPQQGLPPRKAHSSQRLSRVPSLKEIRLSNYPIKDRGYRKKISLDYQSDQSRAFGMRPYNNKVKFYYWLCFLMLGVLTGFVAFGLEKMELFLVGFRWSGAQYFINEGLYGVGFLMYLLTGIILCFTAAIWSLWYGPGAIGSGLPEFMGYVSGINYDSWVSHRTLLTKCLGVVMAVAGGFRIGKEGPLAHIGSNLGVLILYLPKITCTRYFQTDSHKRELIAAGAAAGVSVAFGSPIGGTLLAYESSKHSPYFGMKLMWKAFFAACVATLTLNILEAFFENNIFNIVDAGIIKLGGYI